MENKGLGKCTSAGQERFACVVVKRGVAVKKAGKNALSDIQACGVDGRMVQMSRVFKASMDAQKIR